MTFTTKRLGTGGEAYACRYLLAEGYQLLERNFRCGRYGEIDIVAIKAGIVSFIEVKTRTTLRYGFPWEAVTPVKQEKIRKCAEYYLQLHYSDNLPPVSFDIIAILENDGRIIQFRHYRQCF